MTVIVFAQRLSERFQLLGTDPLLSKRHFFRAGDFQALAVFQRGNEKTRFEQ